MSKGPVQSQRAKQGRLRGVAATETAVLLPVLVLISLGLIDFGRFARAYISVATAARNGATYGSKSIQAGQDSDGIEAAARAEMSSVPGLTESNPRVTSVFYDEGGGHYSVQVTASFQFVTKVDYPGIPGTLTLIRTVHMRIVP